MTLREVATAYHDARSKARRTMTFRLRRQERRLVATATGRPLSNRELARLRALQDELAARGRRGLP